ncbi:MAG: nitroreductase family protein [Clostridia bacterium]|nr:nitroreductase family protein [Clostridia bacterium]
MKTNDFLTTLASRRSIRSFTDAPIAREDLEAIVAAGKCAPSGRNRHSRRLTVVTDPAIIAMLAQVLGEELGRTDYDFYRPTALILLSDTNENHLGLEDCACALTQIFAAAHSLGIGSVWINQFKGLCDRPKVRAALDRIQVPADHCVWGCAALGYAAAPNTAAQGEDTVIWL